MLAPWVSDEMKSADLNDKRLNARLTQVLSALGEHPTASIPAACGGWDEIVAAYRFFDNEKVTYERIMAPHGEGTLQRIAAQSIVLLVQDTTELDFTRPQQQMVGTGSLDGSSRCGAFLHPLVAFTRDGTPLGTCGTTIWVRDEESDETRVETPSERSKRLKATPIEEKESHRWIDGLRQARQVAQQVPEVKCICISDSESDIYELFLEPRGERPVEWLVRACHDRVLEKDAENPAFAAHRLREAVESGPVLFTKEISVRGRSAKVSCETRGRRQPRESRQAQVEVRATTATLLGPPRPGGRLQNTTVNVVQVREVNAPKSDVPVEWLLITTLPVETAEQVREIVQYYAVRFMIEVLFRVLKSGCKVEARRFEHINRMLPCVAVYLIVAWRTLMICRLGQSCPDLDCEAIFDPAEWKSVWMTVKREQPPRQAPKLSEILPLIAQLGGYVNYPNRKDPPGPQTIWLGMQRMYDLALGWNTFGPGAAKAQQTEKTYV
jgi:Transposase DNA-binding/Transposase Tn5 dimerisation domain